MRRHIPLTVAAAIAATAIAMALSYTATAGTPDCSGFRWGDGGSDEGRCWTKTDGPRFTRWLERHGSSAQRFRNNYPHLARTFGQGWGVPEPKPYWKTCVTGEACARAVISQVFGGDISYEMSIVGCETGWTYYNRSVGDAGELGWWQIHPIHRWAHQGGDLFDVRYNTRVAHRLSEQGRDFSPWTCA